MDEQNGRWVTISGRKVFIRTNQHPMDAFIRQKGESEKEQEDKIKDDILNVVNHGQVFEFSVGPTMTICSRYENGNYSELYSSGDTPMKMFDYEVADELKDEFVVVDDGTTRNKRANRFKRYGYEIVGEMEATERDIMNGGYLKEGKDWRGNKWYLLRKKK